MGGVVKAVGCIYTIRGLPLHLCSIHWIGDGRLLAIGVGGGAEIVTATREAAEPIRLAPSILAFYCNVPCHDDQGCISRSAPKEQY